MFKFLFRRKALPKKEANIGNVLLHLGLLTRSQLTEGIKAKLAADKDQLLGEVLIAHGYITRSQLQRALELQVELVGPRPYTNQIRTEIARGIEALKDNSDVIELRHVAERLARKAT